MFQPHRSSSDVGIPIELIRVSTPFNSVDEPAINCQGLDIVRQHYSMGN